MAPDRPTQILIILQLQLVASCVGEWQINVSLRPASRTDVQHELPPVRMAAVEQTWLPIGSGLNPKASYPWRAYHEQQVADTLSTLRGRPFDKVPIANTVHLFSWVLNHSDCYTYMGTSIDDMKQLVDDFVTRHIVLRDGQGLDDLELGLLPVLPVEGVRVHKRS